LLLIIQFLLAVRDTQDVTIASACKTLLADKAFEVPSDVSTFAIETTKKLFMWMQHNEKATSVFERKLLLTLQRCVDAGKTVSKKIQSHKIWSEYHCIRNSDTYVCEWECILQMAGIQSPSVISYQYIGDHMLKQLIKSHVKAIN